MIGQKQLSLPMMSSRSCPLVSAMLQQQLMNLVLAGVEWSQCLVYLDDIIVLGRTFDEHVMNLGTVLQKLKDANLCLQPAKCTLR